MPDLAELYNAQLAEADTILATAETEARLLTAEEQVKITAYEAEAERLKATMEGLEKQRQQRARLTKGREAMSFAVPRVLPGDTPAMGARIDPRIEFAPYPGTLRAFTGEGNRTEREERAYKSGMHILAHCADPEVRARSKQWCIDHGLAKTLGTAVLTEGNNVQGGYLVFPEFERTIIDLRETYGIARREFAVKQMAGDTLSMTRRKTGPTGYYIGETDSITVSDKSWEQLKLTAKTAAYLTKYSGDLNDDAIISLADDLAFEFGWGFSYMEDQAAFIGTGTSTYGGMTGIFTQIDDTSGATYAGSIVTAVAGNTTFGTLDLVDFEGVVGKLPVYAAANAKWYISNAGFWASMARLIDAAGGNTGQMLQGGVGLRFLGFPVVIVQVAFATLTASISTVHCLLGDLRQCCYFGNRRGIGVMTSDQRYFEYNQIGIRATERYAISCCPGDPEAPTTVAGPVIALKTPGS